ncbi:putative Uncharacterized 50.6 kDa protein in the 5'region of gyrA and gyrB [Burkholderia gladioli]|nr:putative Uncharacterized 50.6 kDa protein in the 5'region of gyrA and gyrB [Burkholderia gladioli]
MLRAGPWPQRDHRGGQPPDREAGLFAGLPVRPSAILRTGQQDQGPDARRPRLRILHRLGLGSRRYLAEDGARLLARQGQGQQDAPDRPREGLPRRELRRHLGGRDRAEPQAVRPGHRGRFPAAYATGPEQVLARPARARRRAGRSPARADRAARRLQHRRGDRRAVLGLGRRGGAAQGLPEAPARDLHRARHPADLRRGDHGLRPRRRDDGRGCLRRVARHPELRQAGQQRHPAAGRRGGDQGDLRHLHGRGRPRLHAGVPARLHLFGAPGGLRGRQRRARPAGQGRRRGPRACAGAAFRERRAWPEGRAPRGRHPQLRPGGRHQHRGRAGRAGPPPVRGGDALLGEGFLRALRRRHDPARAAVHFGAARDRQPGRRAGRGAERDGLNRRRQDSRHEETPAGAANAALARAETKRHRSCMAGAAFFMAAAYPPAAISNCRRRR